MKFKCLHKIFAVMIAVILSLTCFIIPASAEKSGICGPDANWSFNEATGELTITGSDEMYDYSEPGHVPWSSITDKIKKITVSEGITIIGKYNFAECSSATEIILPEGLEEIKYGAFDNCSSLTTINIPASVEKIDKSPFYFCLKLATINVDENNEYFCSDSSGVLYNKEKTELIQYPCAKTGANFSVPYTVTTINVAAFAGNGNVKNIIIPESVTTIDSMAFYKCSSLEYITISKGVTMIGDMAFGDCNALSEVHYTGTQDEWNNVSIRENNETLTDKTINFESSGPETVPEDEPTQAVTTTVPQTSSSIAISTEKIKEKREVIPWIIIGIAVVIVILIVVLINVVVNKPDKEDDDKDEDEENE